MNLILNIKPMAKQSVRFTRNGHRYQPAEVVNYHNYLRMVAQQEMAETGQTIFTTAIRVEIIARFVIPKSAPAAMRHNIEKGLCAPKTTKPDIDNLVKATLDPLNGIVWADDALITDIVVAKRWSDRNQVTICVEETL